jgi:hypothetical protein
MQRMGEDMTAPDESPACACSNCGHALETPGGAWFCFEDDGPHTADDACEKWAMPRRIDMNTGLPFETQAVLGPKKGRGK